MIQCPALFISAPASGQGKTTFTAALARYHLNQGRTVRVFKTGPDFLDPMILERASGNPVYQLDLWMVGEQQCKYFLYEAAQSADLILIEGVMGLFDGKPSGADLARAFGIPVLALIDARAMAQTFGAIAHGLRHYQSDLPFAGVVANYVASTGHAAMLAESLTEDIAMLGCLLRDETFSYRTVISDSYKRKKSPILNNGLKPPHNSLPIQNLPNYQSPSHSSRLKFHHQKNYSMVFALVLRRTPALPLFTRPMSTFCRTWVRSVFSSLPCMIKPCQKSIACGCQVDIRSYTCSN